MKTVRKPSYVCSPKHALKKARWGQKLNQWELEKLSKAPAFAFRYANEVLKGRFLAAEEHICQNAIVAKEYAIYIIKGRWEEGELAISKEASASLDYAKFLKCRFELGESEILKHAADENFNFAIQYCKLIGRWNELEQIILNHIPRDRWRREEFPKEVINYCKKFIGGRWQEYEDKLLRENFAKPILKYSFYLGGKLPAALHQKMMMFSFQNKKKSYVKKYLKFLSHCEKRAMTYLSGLDVDERNEILSKL